MNCELFQTIATELARDEKRVLMDAGVRAAAQAHVSDCERCAQTLLDQNNLSEGLLSLAEYMKDWQAPAELETKVLASFPKQINVPSIRPASRHRHYWTSAVAAMLLVGFGLWGLAALRSHVRSGPESRAEKDKQGMEVKSPEPQPTVVATGEAGLLNVSAPRNLPPGRYRRASLRLTAKHVKATPVVAPVRVPTEDSGTREIATDFVPVGYGSALDLQDGGQLVRVEVPRIALARFGLPMNMDRADEKIKADVLLGADGLARAIRFVK